MGSKCPDPSDERSGPDLAAFGAITALGGKSAPSAQSALLVVACAVLGSNAAVQVATAGPAAAAVSGHVLVRSPARDFQSNQSSVATARCPAGKVVVGGGGHVDEYGDPDTETVRLTRLQPVHNGAGDSFMAAAEEPAAGFVGHWQVIAIAICADPLPGYEIVGHSTSVASPTFVATAARCPAGKLVIGTGAKVANGSGEVWLQLMRSSGPRDIARATAREDADGQDSRWFLTAYAICANPIPRTAQQGGISQVQWASKRCEPFGDGRLLSPGGGGGLTDSGPVWVTGVYAESIQTPSHASAVVTMSGLPAGGMAYGGICAER